ncbi:radical SAM protein [Oceanotoga sp. DSM 15011]|uniref:radical SAM protein n=1 Tax=Oceanotoga sp. DSM 15011 TaxID=2984951 RepID=UPI0021F4515C|nr:radical SAM protein [Oceanotoga sp. DSM 15011]UYO98952.1 radical SAM protein [Oceanotoga sp. DSM 15011]
MFESRYRSHHDSGRALKDILEPYIESKRLTKKDFEEVMDSYPKNDKRVLYVHTPYCDKLCTFCNLNRKLLQNGMEQYTNYIVSEFERIGKTEYIKSKPFDALYFGGGTPTTYSESEMDKLLNSLTKNLKYSEDYEFTFETTLHNLTDEKLKIMQNYGVNRLSIGIQTFSDRGRKLLNRTYDQKEILKRLNHLRDIFDGHMCIDIIYAYPDQTEEEVINDAKLTCEVMADSASFYSLMIQPGSALASMIENGKFKFERTNEWEINLHNNFLENINDNYEILELSKIRRKNRDRYRYITLRYDNADTFPVGIGAGGNVANMGVFNMSPEMQFYSYTDEISKKYNKILGHMQYAKYDLKYFENEISEYSMDLLEKRLKEYVKNDYAFEDENKYVLTNEGLFWGNNIAVDLLGLIIKNEFEFNK